MARTVVRVLEREVALDQPCGVGEEGLLGVGSSSASSDELGVVAQLGDGVRRGRRAAAAGVRSSGSRQNSSSSARWTRVPLAVAGWGGSGRWSMEANRNARGHEVNASTREGDKLVGTGYAMSPMLREGCARVGDPRHVGGPNPQATPAK